MYVHIVKQNIDCQISAVGTATTLQAGRFGGSNDDRTKRCFCSPKSPD
jgi:hypothetical protein